MAEQTKRPISIEELKAIAQGQLLDIPGWEPDSTITVRVKRIDVTPQLMKMGTLPNLLRAAAKDAFDGQSEEEAVEATTAKVADGMNFDELIPMMDAMCREALVEPTFEQMEEICPLHFTQKFAIFNFLIAEVKALNSFRNRS